MPRQKRQIAGIGAADLPDLAAILAYVGPPRELIADGVRLRVQDGATPGGIPLRRLDEPELVAEAIKTAAYAVTDADKGKLLVANAAAPVTFSLPALSAATAGAPFRFRNVNTGSLTLQANGTDTIEGAAALILERGGEAVLRSNGAAWRAALTRVEGRLDPETDVAAAAVTDIGAALTERVRITGAGVAITSLGTLPRRERLVRFAGSVTLTHSAAALSLPGAANIVTAAGDMARFVSDAAGAWICVQYQKADGTALVATQTQVADGSLTPAKLAATVLLDHGQCQFGLSGSSGLLVPKNGNALIVNATLQRVPNAGVQAGVSGVMVNGNAGQTLAANTAYWATVYNNAGTPALAYWSFSAGRTRDAATGVEIITGQPGFTVVGMVRTNAAGQLVDTPAQRFVASYFNRATKRLAGANTGGQQTMSTGAYAELTTAARAEALVWADDLPTLGLTGTAYNSGTTATVYTNIGIDGAGTLLIDASPQVQNATNFLSNPSAPAGAAVVSEGYHFFTPLGLVGSGTGIYFVAVVGAIRS